MSEREAAVAKAREEAPDASETLTRRVAAMADEKLGEDIVVLDMRELVSYTDFLVLVTARNERLAKAIADDVR
ncbi:MAG TPA: RsfS/YbeB/iojap family protein, partial [Solirubrobacterales bacterium]|nr:RsfS/YbeB/iojap family protein [Solirubrobacterales bacterium]